jgi:hypothetical protein
MPTPYIRRSVNLEPLDYHIVCRLARRKGLGKRGFSAALRLILRDWARLEAQRIPDASDLDALLANLRDYPSA